MIVLHLALSVGEEMCWMCCCFIKGRNKSCTIVGTQQWNQRMLQHTSYCWFKEENYIYLCLGLYIFHDPAMSHKPKLAHARWTLVSCGLCELETSSGKQSSCHMKPHSFFCRLPFGPPKRIILSVFINFVPWGLPYSCTAILYGRVTELRVQ